jgi:peptidyl-tRNA hydrolase, PTH1 family
MIECIVGLGNPGTRYETTRHNAGYWFVDRFVHDYTAEWREQKKFFGLYATCLFKGRKLHVLKPTTYMNHSGRAVKALLAFYNIKPESLLVVHDELDFPPGVVRFKQDGGTGGHQGLNDIVSMLSGCKQFSRLRVGIGHPGHSSQVTNYVLKKALVAEQLLIDQALVRTLAVMPLLLAGESEHAVRLLHQQDSDQGLDQ